MLLLQEATALGYPLRVLRLSIATYLLERVIRIGRVVSKSVVAIRGITAGSGFATTEMRIIMIRIVDEACKLYPMIVPTLFVDDLATDVTAPAKFVVKQLGGVIETVAKFIDDTKQELSKTKSLLTATTAKIGDELCSRWKKMGILIKFRRKVKALGVGLGAGIRRNVTVARGRLQGYTARVARFRQLRKIGVDTARLLRTVLKAMTYGSSIMGFADGMLRSQRQVAAAIAAPGAGTGGQNLDIALMIADGSSKGKADPAFDAHMMPIGEWSMACWEGWATDGAMEVIVKAAKLMIKKR